jgi:hypothetical protein
MRLRIGHTPQREVRGYGRRALFNYRLEALSAIAAVIWRMGFCEVRHITDF